MTQYRFSDDNYFVIEQYDKAKTFSSFLPGVAGLYGIPIWSFFVNRGQAMASFGIKDKDNAIMEFFPANQAYQQVSLNGFRTFIKVLNKENDIFEPFSPLTGSSSNQSRTMFIKENELKIEEINYKYGIQTTVTYFIMPNESFGALVRRVELSNISNDKLEFEILDGMPAILPYGISNTAYKEVGNTLKSWMDVYNLENNIPFYRVRSSTADTAEVEEVTKGHFYLSVSDDGKMLEPIVDIDLIFGQDNSLSFPHEFLRKSVSEITNDKQVTSNKVPCGFTGFNGFFAPGEKKEFYTLIGHVKDIETINEKAKEVTNFDYIQKKYKESQTLVSDITKDVLTRTSSPLFDAYIKQSYLDNVLRGGYPVSLSNGQGSFIYYVFSRKHGDLERDYNFFLIAPEYFSQGNGNFRDVNQNRRNDIFFHPETGDYNIKLFMNLIQPDGYNPLVVKGSSFVLNDHNEFSWLRDFFEDEADIELIEKKLVPSYTPGELFKLISDNNMSMILSLPDFLKEILSKSNQQIEAEFVEGYWIDHWTYNLDLIENYLMIYPDNKERLLFEDDSYTYFSSHAFVEPRAEKYVLTTNGKVRQYGAVSEMSYLNNSQWATTNDGQIYKNTLFSKLFSLALIKFSTLDPFGMGIEMEANKPGWNDSMNGLPGMFGSSMSETLELKRLLEFIIGQNHYGEKYILLPVEVRSLLNGIVDVLIEYNNGKLTDFQYWDECSSVREKYREMVKVNFSGLEERFELHELITIAEKLLDKVLKGIQQAKEYGDGLIPTYFLYDAADWERVLDDNGKEKRNHKGYPVVQVNSFKMYALPHFLEGPAKEMKSEDPQKASDIYRKVRESEIYDDKLKMYKTSASLEEESQEIGRARAFTPGWLERESVFMHMELKYFLGILKAGLYDEFFEDIIHALPPFFNPEVYGRSPLENSSFIASSVNPDPAVHGRGFVARLSGTTAEFLTIWQIMMAGKELFKQENRSLTLKFNPILPAWLFDQAGQIKFTFLGKTIVTYHNVFRKNTFGDEGVKPTQYVLHLQHKKVKIESDKIEEPYSKAIREGKVEKIDVYLN